MDKIHYDEIKDKLESFTLVKTHLANAKNNVELKVYECDEFYYKIWPSDFYKKDVVEVAVNNGFYDEKTTPVLKSLIYDDTGNRGYITRKGNHVVAEKSNDWSKFIKNTTKKQRKQFILDILDRSWNVKGIHTDIGPTNLVLYNGQISLIDLDSYSSYNFIFYKKPEDYEKFINESYNGELYDIQEDAKYDVNLLYTDYIDFCLGIVYGKKIDNEYALLEIREIIKSKSWSW